MTPSGHSHCAPRLHLPIHPHLIGSPNPNSLFWVQLPTGFSQAPRLHLARRAGPEKPGSQVAVHWVPAAPLPAPQVQLPAPLTRDGRSVLQSVRV
jgi:hypothetical protein